MKLISRKTTYFVIKFPHHCSVQPRSQTVSVGGGGGGGQNNFFVIFIITCVCYICSISLRPPPPHGGGRRGKFWILMYPTLQEKTLPRASFPSKAPVNNCYFSLIIARIHVYKRTNKWTTRLKFAKT